MRVLLISHTCQSRTEGQPRAHHLAHYPDIELKVLIPDRWMHYGRWRLPDPPQDPGFSYEYGRVAWPWVGPAQFYLHWYPRLSRILKEFQPEIIDLWEEPWGLVSAQACWLRDRILPGAWIVSETEQNINKTLPPPFEQTRRYTLRKASAAVCRNQEAVEVIRSKGFRGPVDIIPNGVDSHLFRPLDRGSCRRELGIQGFTAGYMGRMVEEKGLMDLVEALRSCSNQVRILFVGDGPFREALQRRVQELGKTEQVQFLDARPLEELPRLMNALDVLVLPSRTTATWKEQFGRVIIEAHACQVPVIGSNSGSIPEVVGNGGLIVPERSPDALAEALETLRNDPDHAKEMALAGFRQVHSLYTWSRIAERYHRLYQQITEYNIG